MPALTSTCPICDGQVNLSSDVEESEIISCQECSNRLVVASVSSNPGVTLEEAPEIEEDWGQ